MNEDLIYIKKFAKISIKKICRNLKIDYINTYRGRTTKKNYNLIKKQIESEIAKLYIIKDEEDE